MNQEEVALLRQATDELARTRERLHKINDMVQSHEVKLGEHSILLTMFAGELETLKQNVATKEHVEAGVTALTLKLDNLADKVAPIRSGVHWLVILVLGAVVTAILTLVLRGGG